MFLSDNVIFVILFSSSPPWSTSFGMLSMFVDARLKITVNVTGSVIVRYRYLCYFVIFVTSPDPLRRHAVEVRPRTTVTQLVPACSRSQTSIWHAGIHQRLLRPSQSSALAQVYRKYHHTPPNWHKMLWTLHFFDGFDLPDGPNPNPMIFILRSSIFFRGGVQ